MKIYGIGTDIINIKRMKNILKKMVNSLKTNIFLIKKSIIVKERKTQVLFTQKDLLRRKLLQKL